MTDMIIVHERQPDKAKRPDREFGIMLHEWKIAAGAARPDANEVTDFNMLTMNGKAMPSTEPLVPRLGDRVWIRDGNLSAMDHHPIHLHGYAFKFPNMVEVNSSGVDEKIRTLIPGYMTMGTAGMRDMTRMNMPLPVNSIPMLGYKGQFGQTVLGGMANGLKVRENLESYEDPEPYEFPAGTVSRKATKKEMKADGITVDMPDKLR